MRDRLHGMTAEQAQLANGYPYTFKRATPGQPTRIESRKGRAVLTFDPLFEEVGEWLCWRLNDHASAIRENFDMGAPA